MKNKLCLICKIKSYYQSIVINPFRLWLTLIGILIGIITFICGVVVVDSYKNTYYENFATFNDDLVCMQSFDGFQDNIIRYLDTQIADATLTYYTMPFTIMEQKDDILVNYCIRGASSNMVDNYMIDVNTVSMNEHPIVYTAPWFYGREWNDDDVQKRSNKIIINCYGAQLFYGQDNPIGQSIELNNVKYQIIGVTANSESTENKIAHVNYLKSKGRLNRDQLVELYPAVEIFMPYVTFVKNLNNNSKPAVVMIKSANYYSTSAIVKNIRKTFVQELSQNNITLSEIGIIKNSIKSNLSEVNIVFGIIIAFVIVVSGITMTNTLFYNIKEKIPEIGIRKAMGATNSDIFKQIIFEGIYYVGLAFILGAIISLILLYGASLVLLFFPEIGFTITINFVHILLVGLIMLAESVVFSIIPALYAAKMKIVDAIRFE